MARRRVLAGNGSASQDTFIQEGAAGGNDVAVANDGVTVVPAANTINFSSAFQVTQNGVNPNQADVDIAGPLSMSPGQQLYIYYDAAGSDTTGNGSLANPYKTLQRALFKYPSYVGGQGSAIVWLPVNPLTETTQQVITLPPMQGDGSVCEPTIPVTGFSIFQNYNILAPLQDLLGGHPLLPSDIYQTTSQDHTHRITLFLHNNPNLPLTPNALIGQFLVDASGTVACITGNDDHTIEVDFDSGEIDLTNNIQIYGCGVTIYQPGSGDVIQIGSQVQFLQVGGMEFINDNVNTYPHQGVVSIRGASNLVFQACHLQGIDSRAVKFLTLFGCNVGKVAAQSNITIDGEQILFYRCHCRAAFDQFNFFGYYHLYTSAIGCDRIGSTQGVGSVGSFQIGNTYLAAAPAASMAIYISDQCFTYNNVIENGSFGILGVAPGGFCDVRNSRMSFAAYADIAALNGTLFTLDGPQGTIGVTADRQQFIDAATVVAVVPQGTPGVSTDRYLVIAVSTHGSLSLALAVVCSTSNATLDNTNFNHITWVDPVDPNFDHIEVWCVNPSIRLAGRIGVVAKGVQVLDDKGQAPSASMEPIHDLISWTDFAAIGSDTDNAPYSGGVVRSRVAVMPTP